MSYSDIVAIVLSAAALAFSVFSFWWVHGRVGRLHVSRPRSYAAGVSTGRALVLEFPFVFVNDGPTPLIVESLRLLFSDETSPRPLTFTATVAELATDKDRKLATQFPVRAGEVLPLVCEFQRNPSGLAMDAGFQAGSYRMELQALLSEHKGWCSLCHFPLNISLQQAESIPQYFVAHDNLAGE